MDGLRISQLAERVGVATSTVRYYERIGLVPGPGRTASGYRVYGSDAEARLLFITRGKRLGLSLEEIAELVAIWDGTHCGATQDRLSWLLDAKRAEIAEQIRELERFADQLADVQGHLAAAPGSEGCAPDLACCAPALPDTPVTISLSPGDPTGQAASSEGPTVIDRHRLRRLLDEDGVQLAEVLPKDEYVEEHLPGAVHLPLKQLDAHAATRALDPSRPVVVYCWDGL